MSTFDPHESLEFESSPSPSSWRPLLILRDVLIVFGFTFAGGFVIGFVGAMRGLVPAQFMMAIAITNLLCGTAAFTLIGCIAPPGRWHHLLYVALFTWLASAINIFLIGATVNQWLFGSLAVLIMMGVGGGLSFLFKKEPIDERRPRSTFNYYQTAPDECPMCGAGIDRGSTRCSECGEVFSY